MAPHSSTLAWKIPWSEEPGGLQSIESHSNVRHILDFTAGGHLAGQWEASQTHHAY